MLNTEESEKEIKVPNEIEDDSPTSSITETKSSLKNTLRSMWFLYFKLDFIDKNSKFNICK